MTLPKKSIDGTSTDDDDMPNLHSTGYDKSVASKDEQADCKANEDVILPKAGIYSFGAGTLPDSKNAHVKIKNETHGLIIYNIPEALEGTPVESRAHDTQAISEVFERVLAPSESVKILRTCSISQSQLKTCINN